jgi:hypothetical protein
MVVPATAGELDVRCEADVMQFQPRCHVLKEQACDHRNRQVEKNYVRVSTKEQTENLSLPTQLRACEEYCRRQGYEVVERFHEKGESAKSTDRSQLQNLLTFCRLNIARGANACADRPSLGQLEELDVEGILACAERILPRAADLWVQASLEPASAVPTTVLSAGNRVRRK